LKAKKAGSVVGVVENLSSGHKALSSNHSSTEEKIERERRDGRREGGRNFWRCGLIMFSSFLQIWMKKDHRSQLGY
jgi:hypothetical protein